MVRSSRSSNEWKEHVTVMFSLSITPSCGLKPPSSGICLAITACSDDETQPLAARALPCLIDGPYRLTYLDFLGSRNNSLQSTPRSNCQVGSAKC